MLRRERKETEEKHAAEDPDAQNARRRKVA
jgi:hypothetical protein